jgi:hypothetical protein
VLGASRGPPEKWQKKDGVLHPGAPPPLNAEPSPMGGRSSARCFSAQSCGFHEVAEGDGDRSIVSLNVMLSCPDRKGRRGRHLCKVLGTDQDGGKGAGAATPKCPGVAPKLGTG